MRVLKKRLLIAFCVVVFAFVGFVLLNIPFSKLALAGDVEFVTQQELLELSSKNYFGPFISATIKDTGVIDAVASRQETDFSPEIEFKLFNLIPIKSSRIKVIKDDKIYASGQAIGLVLKTDGVLIVGSSPVLTADGEKDALSQGRLKIGDIIKSIENETVENVSSISKIINEDKNKGRELEIKLVRKNKEVVARVKPFYDIKDENYKLGVWVRDDASGIGTLTFIKKDNRFGALGHPICDSDTKGKITLKEGKMYNCSILGVNKGKSGTPGEIKGLFMQNKGEQGVIEKNNDYGVFGNLKKDNNIVKNAVELEIGGRLSVKPGKAKIMCCIDLDKVETFDIEIIKTNFQNYSNDKSMVLRVTDEDLIKRTGGIVQGMSGSPIIQDGKIVGAVTHVFVSDPLKGFGVYVDWMLNQ